MNIEQAKKSIPEKVKKTVEEIEDETIRILIVDDNNSIHEDLRLCLTGKTNRKSEKINSLEQVLFSSSEENEEVTNRTFPNFAIDYHIDDAYQGLEAIKMVDQAVMEGKPFSVIFMDVRMPPGIDGITTMKRIWEKHPYTEIILCTAYSDYSWDEIVAEFGDTDHLLFIKKPFDNVAVQQTTLTLAKKWKLDQINRRNFEEMEGKIEKRTEELNRMVKHLDELRKKAEAATIAKGQFLSKMSHEIRTPLNGIMGMTELLLDSRLNQEQFNCAYNIKTSSDSLMDIINGILDFSKIEAGKIAIDAIEFSLRTTVENVAEIAAPAAHKKGLEIATLIEGNIPDTFIGDPGKIRQIILNLANNAIKYTPKGEIFISVTKVNDSDSLADDNTREITLEFAVKDTGIGISEDDQNQLFQPFSQVRVANHYTREGTGLGLVICKQLCELMGGSITVTSTPGEGSTFSFTLQVAIAETKSQKIDYQAMSIKGTKCLVLSNNKTSRKILSIYISHWGGECIEAENRFEAEKRVNKAEQENKPFDVIIVDFKGRDLALYQEIASTLPDKNQAPLVCLTDLGTKGDAEKLKDVGYIAYLTSPLKQSHLHHAILLAKGIVEKEIKPYHGDKILTKHSIDELIQERYRVLVAEDNQTNTMILVKMLAKAHISTDVVENGEEAVEAFKKNEYDLIFMDCFMPVMDGFEATKMIRKIPGKGEKVKIVAITADVFEKNRDNCIQAGMDSVLTKPYKMTELYEVLKKHLH